MSTDEAKPLTVVEIFELVAVVDSERERVKQLIVDNPSAKSDNEQRRDYINKLNILSQRLTSQIERNNPSFKICLTCKTRNIVDARECHSCGSTSFGNTIKFTPLDQSLI